MTQLEGLKTSPKPQGRGRQALMVLVGVTAHRRERRYLMRYLSSHCDQEVFVPDLPYRRPLPEVAAWYSAYLADVVGPERFTKLHCIAYIAARALLRCLPSSAQPGFDRMVCFRGPYQELLAARLLGRIGRTLTQLVAGRTVLDLADGWPERLPLQRMAVHQGLIVERGVSRLARWLGIRASDVPVAAWSAQVLLPGAEAVLYIPLSHDDVYTNDTVLNAALSFIEDGEFPELSP